ncbi:uncharacterized protein BJX67DRAFT_376552 [Aspergillus lucknowensis]|uniref:Uncharacterized protein n=1 Tax=Aspergillus lucknowensis TaxID=176173 RepID=A0ABR4M825_9EURO
MDSSESDADDNIWTEEWYEPDKGNPQCPEPGFYHRLNLSKVPPKEGDQNKYLRIQTPDEYYVPLDRVQRWKAHKAKDPLAKVLPGSRDPGTNCVRLYNRMGEPVFVKMPAEKEFQCIDACKDKEAVTLASLNQSAADGSGPGADSLYFRIKSDQVKRLDVQGGAPDATRDGEDFYIPTSTFKEWKERRADADKEGGSQVSQRRTSSSYFIDGRNGQGQPSRIEVRVDPTLEFQNWDRRFKNAIRHSRARGGAGRCLDEKIKLFLMPVSDEVFDMLSRAVDATKAKLRMDSEEARSCNQTVTLWKKHPQNLNEYKKIAISPLHHYETWIEKVDYNSYVLKFPDRIPPKDAEIQLVRIKEQDKKGASRQQGQTQPSSSGSKRQSTSKKQTENNTVTLRPCKDDALEAKVKQATATLGENIKGSNADAVLGEDKESVQKKLNSSEVLASHVTKRKIEAQAGARGDCDGQLTVMGASATDIAKAFGWTSEPRVAAVGAAAASSASCSPVQWRESAFAAAEWLHRSAFSWGGLLPPGKGGKDAANSSQIPRNLVFGTSECNSIMTRYEAAFKDLITRDAEQSPSNNTWNGGILVTELKRDKYKEKYADDEPVDQPQHFRNLESPKYSWLSLAMDYTLYVNRPTSRVGRFLGPYKQTFYPFQRGFYTKFEYYLDKAVLNEVYSEELEESTTTTSASTSVSASASSSVSVSEEPKPEPEPEPVPSTSSGLPLTRGITVSFRPHPDTRPTGNAKGNANLKRGKRPSSAAPSTDPTPEKQKR